MPDDVILVLCGGGATNFVQNWDRRPEVPFAIVDSNYKATVPMAYHDYKGCRGDTLKASIVAEESAGSLEALFEGRRIAFIFTMLGGGTGTGMAPVLVDIAHRCGCRAVTILGMPWGQEPERRSVALQALPSIVERSDRSFLLDMESLPKLYMDVKFRRILELFGNMVMFAVDNLCAIADGPFFSTFSQKAYTFACTTGLAPDAALELALESTLFETDPSCGRMIVALASGTGGFEKEAVFDRAVNINGIIPDILERDDRDDARVLVFVPVRPVGLSSPRACRS